MAHVRVEGLSELRRDLRRAQDAEGTLELREGLRQAANVVVRDAQGRVQSKTGRTRESIRATMSGNRAFVVGGKSRVPWYGWYDFGSRTPRSGQSRSVGPWANTGRGPHQGRLIYPAIEAKERQIADLVEDALSHALRRFDL